MIILGTNSIKDTGYNVANSLRFENGSSDHLTKNFSGTQDSRRKFTVSSWIKRSKLSDGDQRIWGSSEGSGEGYNSFGWNGSDKLKVLSGNTSNSGTQLNFESNQVFRDVSAWSHLVYAVDTTQGTESNRVKIYHNGTQITSWGTATYPSQNTDLLTSTTPQMTIGMRDLRGTDANFYSGYISEFVFIDNQQLDPTSFGEFDEDSGIWKPIDVSGLTFGTNGFYLDFENSGALGADVSGNSNNFTVNNLTAIDQSTDTCTNNFATMSPIDFAGSAPTLSNGNLTVATSSADRPIRATMGFSKGKWYAEYRFEASDNDNHIGCYSLENSLSTTYIGGNLYSWGLNTSNGNKRNNGSNVSYGSAIGYSNSIVMIAIDKDNGKIWWGKDGTWFASGDPANGTNEAFSNINTVVGADGFVTFADLTYRNGSWNFGSPSFAISSGNTDGNGYGNFEYAVPSGYYSLNSKNLSEFG